MPRHQVTARNRVTELSTRLVGPHLFLVALALSCARSVDAQAAPASEHVVRASRSDPFAHRYEFSPGVWKADDVHPGERGGLSVAAGFGAQFAGLGAQIAYYYRAAPSRLLVPFLAVGIAGNNVSGFQPGPAAGVLGMIGSEDHWLSAASFGLVGDVYRRGSEPPSGGIGFFTTGSASRALYAAALEFGREWMYRNGGLFRLTLGIYLIPDAASDSWIYPSFSIGGGWKS
jgi:hypothetical protein